MDNNILINSMKHLMTYMINLDYIAILRKTNQFLLFSLNNLSIENTNHQDNYLQVISQFKLNFNRELSRFPDEKSIQDIGDEEQKTYLLEEIRLSSSPTRSEKQEVKDIPYFEDMENILCAVPQTIKFTQKNITHYYHFVVGKHCVLVCVSDEFDPSLRQDLVHLNRQFEILFSEEQINSTDHYLHSNTFLFAFTDLLTQKLINRYYIPHLVKNSILIPKISHYSTWKQTDIDSSLTEVLNALIEYLSKTNNALKNTLSDKLTSEIDGISDIEAISTNLRLDSLELAKILLYLWLENQLIFRVPIYPWNIFERTHKSNEYLLDGSESQKILLERYGGGKIISLLSRFDGRNSVAEIQKKMKIKELRFMRFVYDLVDMELIQRSEKYPVLRHIREEIVPLLVIQGLQQNDLKIIEELESRFDGSKSITSVALKMDQSPEKIKQILDKIPEFVQYNSI